MIPFFYKKLTSLPKKDSIIVSGITLVITRKAIKHLLLRIHHTDGSVNVSAPEKMSLEEIRGFVLLKVDWIRKRQSKIFHVAKSIPQRFVTGEIIYFLGKPYILNVFEDDISPKIHLTDSTLEMFVRPGMNVIGKRLLLQLWYREQLRKFLLPNIIRLENTMKVGVNELRFRSMYTRWGTCNITAKRIWLNTELAKHSTDSVLYVLTHEMVHLLERCHNEKFKKHMDSYFPDWKRQKNILNQGTIIDC